MTFATHLPTFTSSSHRDAALLLSHLRSDQISHASPTPILPY